MKQNLDQIALECEFLIISVIQGVALAALANFAYPLFGNLEFEYWLYAISAFLLILNFWSQAIIHAISFIDWPLDLPHNFLYLLASFVEVMAFSYMDKPLYFFAFISIFFLIAIILYIVDMRLIKQHEQKFLKNNKTKLFHHIVKREQFEFKILLPLAILFNLASFGGIYLFPNLFIDNKFHMLLIGIQSLFGLVVLVDSTRSFQKRAKLIND